MGRPLPLGLPRQRQLQPTLYRWSVKKPCRRARIGRRRASGPATPPAIAEPHERTRAAIRAHVVLRSVEVIAIERIESEPFWAASLRSFAERGLAGVRLAVCDEHQALKNAIAPIRGCPERRTVHFVRDWLRHCRHARRGMVSAALRDAFYAESEAAAREWSGQVIERWAGPAPNVAELRTAAEGDLLAFIASRRTAGRSCARRTPCRAGQLGDRPAGRRRRDLPA